MSRMKRKSTGIPVFVVEDHNHVVPCIYRKIGSKKLPFSNLALLHFDAHSDMSSPKLLSALDIHDIETVYDSINIESWIVPMMYSGHVNSIAWIKPPWTQDSMSESSCFLVGRDTLSNEICVSSTDNYFLSELSYCPEEKLADTHTVNMIARTLPFCTELSQEKNVTENYFASKKLRIDSNASHESNKSSVYPTDEIIANLSSDLNQIIGVSDSKRDYILDIDLDFFSTEDPFVTSLTTEQYALMKELYRFSPPSGDRSFKEGVDECVRKRREQIKELRYAIQLVNQGKPYEEFADEERNALFKKFLAESVPSKISAASKDSEQSASDEKDAHCGAKIFSNSCYTSIAVCKTFDSNGKCCTHCDLDIKFDLDNSLDYDSSNNTFNHPELDKSKTNNGTTSSTEISNSIRAKSSCHSSTKINNTLSNISQLGLNTDTYLWLGCDSSSNEANPLNTGCHLGFNEDTFEKSCYNATGKEIVAQNTDQQSSLNNELKMEQCSSSISAATNVECQTTDNSEITIKQCRHLTNASITQQKEFQTEQSAVQPLADANTTQQKLQTSSTTGEANSDLNETVDLEWLHEIGTGIDDSPLPHYKSDWRTMECLIHAVKVLLRQLNHPPTVITIARSSNDGYCPADQVDRIQQMVLEMLENLYGPLDVSLRYLDDQ